MRRSSTRCNSNFGCDKGRSLTRGIRLLRSRESMRRRRRGYRSVWRSHRRRRNIHGASGWFAVASDRIDPTKGRMSMQCSMRFPVWLKRSGPRRRRKRGSAGRACHRRNLSGVARETRATGDRIVPVKGRTLVQCPGRHCGWLE